MRGSRSLFVIIWMDSSAKLVIYYLADCDVEFAIGVGYLKYAEIDFVLPEARLQVL